MIPSDEMRAVPRAFEESQYEYPFPADAALYDPWVGTFTSLGTAIRPRAFSAATLIPDGTVLITGGQLPGGSGESGAELLQAVRELATSIALIHVRVPAADISKSNLEANTGFDQLRDL